MTDQQDLQNRIVNEIYSNIGLRLVSYVLAISLTLYEQGAGR